MSSAEEASALACSSPVPGPFYWDWKCLRCGHAVAQHKSWWQKINPYKSKP